MVGGQRSGAAAKTFRDISGGWGVSVPLFHTGPRVNFAAGGAGPDFVAGSKCTERAFGYSGAGAAQGTGTARGAGLTGNGLRGGWGRFQCRDPRLKRLDSAGHGAQGFPHRDLIKDFEHV